ncbi:hypothetical protein [Nonomuraea sp. NPDC049158]|uniref:hypothetical protein n=1 Tax=Nonomuraea sp. NPDC049158 TaxID=3155649 RepID=UPI003406D6F6
MKARELHANLHLLDRQVISADDGHPVCKIDDLLPDGAVDLFHAAYRPAPDAATLRRARGWAVGQALAGILIGDAGVHGRPGGKPTWGPPAHAALRRLIATAHR